MNFMNKKDIFVFDVDGVIVDSTDECLVVAWNAYIKYSHSEKKIISTTSEANKEYAEHFRSIRNYVRSMDEYLLVFKTTKNEVTSQKKYEEILSGLNEEERDRYGEYFFNERKVLKQLQKENWLALHHVYDGIVELFKNIHKQYNVYIVTGKDKESVMDFLVYFRIDFDSKKIYDKKIARNKLIALKEISKKENIPTNKIAFLDDNVTHLIKPMNANFDVMLAEWGYGQDEHFILAKEHSLPIVSIKDIYKRFLNEVN